MENPAVISSSGALSFSFPAGTVERSNDGCSIVEFSCLMLSWAVVFGPGEDVMCDAAALAVEVNDCIILVNVKLIHMQKNVFMIPSL